MKSEQLDLFIKKFAVICYLYEKYNYDFQELAYILNDDPQVIETYCDQLVCGKKMDKSKKS